MCPSPEKSAYCVDLIRRSSAQWRDGVSSSLCPLLNLNLQYVNPPGISWMLSVRCVRGVTKLLSVQFAWTQLWNPPQRKPTVLSPSLSWIKRSLVPFYWGHLKEDSVYWRTGNKEIKFDMLKKKRNRRLFSDKAEKPETFAWTPSMSVYSWPQINLSGKYNPPLYHLSLLIPTYEHTRMPTSGDSQQPMKDKCLLFFFFPCPAWKWKTRKQSQHAGAYQCISWSSTSLSFSHFDISRPRKLK